MRAIPVALLLAAWDEPGSLDGYEDDDGGPGCAIDAVVTDIDATLTTSDLEFVQLSFDPDYDPAMRPDADDLMRGYADRGYAVVYISPRGEDQPMQGGATALQATEDWLTDHGFPLAAGRVFLAPGLGAQGSSATYKADLLAGLSDEYAFEYGYGNENSDIAAFRDAGMDDDALFLVGDLAGQMGVTGISNEEAFTDHLPFLAQVPDADCADE